MTQLGFEADPCVYCSKTPKIKCRRKSTVWEGKNRRKYGSTSSPELDRGTSRTAGRLPRSALQGVVDCCKDLRSEDTWMMWRCCHRSCGPPETDKGVEQEHGQAGQQP
jgi:hypothetical protein